MGDGTSIEWTEASWNPVRGCSRVSRGCEHCYAEGVARRFSGPGQPYEGLVRLDREGRAKAQWNGTVRMVPEHLADPLRWSRPRRVFVNSMSDLFHEALAFEDIAAIFGVMAACPRHTFQVLTKRPERALAFFADFMPSFAMEHRGIVSAPCQHETAIRAAFDGIAKHAGEQPSRTALDAAWRRMREAQQTEAYRRLWPLPNVWLGVSVEDQATADERIPHLLACPAAVRWVSYEPAIGPVVFRPEWLPPVETCDACGERIEYRNTVPGGNAGDASASCGCTAEQSEPCDPMCVLDWIVVGGESGPGARPFDLAWARSAIAQCREAGTACFVKQLGSHLVADCMRCRGDGIDPMRVDGSDPDWCAECGGAAQSGIAPRRVLLDDRKGGDLAEWPPYIRVREWPEARR